MVLEETDFAKANLRDYQLNSKKAPDNLFKYVKSLLDTITFLQYNPYLGKNFCQIQNFQIKQLIHKEHRILYLINDNKIIILSLIHTKYQLKQALNFIKNYISNL